MSYVRCPDCGKQIEVFGPSRAAALAEEFGAKACARIPFDTSLTACADGGTIEAASGDYLGELFRSLL